MAERGSVGVVLLRELLEAVLSALREIVQGIGQLSQRAAAPAVVSSARSPVVMIPIRAWSGSNRASLVRVEDPDSLDRIAQLRGLPICHMPLRVAPIPGAEIVRQYIVVDGLCVYEYVDSGHSETVEGGKDE